MLLCIVCPFSHIFLKLYRSNDSTSQTLQPYPSKYSSIEKVNAGYTSSDQDADMLDLVQSNGNAVMLDVMKGYTPAPPPPSIPELAKQYINSGNECSFINFIKEQINEDAREEIFRKTKKQHRCMFWKQQRIGAVTASMLHKVARCKGTNDNNYIVQMIMGEATFTGNSATRYGNKHEPVAKKLYEKCLRINHKGVTITNSGLIVWKENPLIRASPDGIVSCKCCEKGIIEIKCPASIKYKHLTGEEIARDGTYHLELVNNQPKLKHSSPWYTQIQIQLGVSQYAWCDLVLFTKKPPHLTTERIYFDSEKFNMEVERALTFHTKFIMPRFFGLSYQ